MLFGGGFLGLELAHIPDKVRPIVFYLDQLGARREALFRKLPDALELLGNKLFLTGAGIYLGFQCARLGIKLFYLLGLGISLGIVNLITLAE